MLAVGSFTTSPFRSGVSFLSLYSIHFTILHFISPTFISPTSAPHSKSNSLSAFHKSNAIAFRVLASRFPTLNILAHSGLLKPLQAPKAICFIPFSHCICFYPTLKEISVCFIFSCEAFTPSNTQNTLSF